MARCSLNMLLVVTIRGTRTSKATRRDIWMDRCMLNAPLVTLSNTISSCSLNTIIFTTFYRYIFLKINLSCFARILFYILSLLILIAIILQLFPNVVRYAIFIFSVKICVKGKLVLHCKSFGLPVTKGLVRNSRFSP
jgi:hypothetical protein